MFGKRERKPDEVVDLVLDRIGLAEADAVNLEIWYATFEGVPGIRRIHVRSIGIERKPHLVLARRGDRIRLTIRRDAVVGFENLDMKA